MNMMASWIRCLCTGTHEAIIPDGMLTAVQREKPGRPKGFPNQVAMRSSPLGKAINGMGGFAQYNIIVRMKYGNRKNKCGKQ